jgi:Tol biopolymer transport system component
VKPSQLRSWVRDRGAPGLLLAALYLGVHSLWTKRRPFCLAVALAAVLSVGMLRHLAQPVRSRPAINKLFSPPPTLPIVLPPEEKIGSCGTLAYMHQGDISLLELPDGHARRLTADGQNTRLSWSPTGKWLAFVRAEKLWVMSRSGQQARQLSEEANDFAWSPVSDTLAYYQEDNLCLVHPDTWRPRVVVAAPHSSSDGGGRYENEEVAWSPDGKWLAYAHCDYRTKSVGNLRCVSSLRCLRADGRDPRQVYWGQGEWGGGFVHPAYLRWYPDSRRILFWTEVMGSSSINADGAPLWAASREGNAPHRLVGRQSKSEPGGTDGWVLQRADFVAFAPNGKRLVISQGSSRHVIENKWLISLDLATGHSRRLTEPEWACTCPAWSPDSKHLVYCAAPDDESMEWSSNFKHRHLWRMDADGSHKRPLTQDNAYEDDRPIWLADGKHILFTRKDGDEIAGLWIVGADGHGVRKIAEVEDKDTWRSECFAVWTPGTAKF